jgi:hypothetical protein
LILTADDADSGKAASTTALSPFVLSAVASFP